MRKAIDTLLFSGDFTPTTFNLAFFMHSLFREDIEREAKVLKEEREASYAEYLAEEGGRSPGALAARADLRQQDRAHRSAAVASARPEAAAAPAAARGPRRCSGRAAAGHGPRPRRTPPPPRTRPTPARPSLSSREAASGFTFHKDEAPARARRPCWPGSARSP